MGQLIVAKQTAQFLSLDTHDIKRRQLRRAKMPCVFRLSVSVHMIKSEIGILHQIL